jgi:hypothetical protein
MTATCDSEYQGLVVRLTRLDECGNIVAGACGYATSKGFIKVGLEKDEEEGEAIAPKLANGERCFYRKTRPQLNGYGVDIEFCNVDPELFEIATGVTLVTDDAVAPVTHGFAVDSASYGDANFALELWTNLALNDCTVGGTTRRWGYLLLPWLTGGTFTPPDSIENKEVNFSISGAMTQDGNQWGIGPYDIQLDKNGDPSPLYTALSATSHLLKWKVNVAPPTPTCGCQTLSPVT